LYRHANLPVGQLSYLGAILDLGHYNGRDPVLALVSTVLVSSLIGETSVRGHFNVTAPGCCVNVRKSTIKG